MFAHLRKFAKEADLKGIKASGGMSVSLTTEQKDAAVEMGMAHIRAGNSNFSVDERDLRSAIRGLAHIAAMTAHPSEAAIAQEAHDKLAAWVEMQILSSTASTYGHLFKIGMDNPYWSEAARTAAKEACAYFNL